MNKKNIAFTLAESLITIGIIGVVSAMTLPMLIQNYQKKVFAIKLKKTVVTLENGFKKMLADEAVEELKYTSVFSNTSIDGANDIIVDKNFKKSLKKYFNIVKFSTFNPKGKYPYLKGNRDMFATTTSSYPSYFFNDGVMIFGDLFKAPWQSTDSEEGSERCKEVKKLGGHVCASQGYFYIDVNGLNKPNIMGRDLFFFRISNTGLLYPVGGLDESAMMLSTRTWTQDYWQCGYPNKPLSAYKGEISGWGCAARIVENGWEIDY